MNYSELLSGSRQCKEYGYYIKKIRTENITEQNFLDYASPFRYGYISINKEGIFHTPALRTQKTKLSIHTYNDNLYQVGDLIRIDDKFYYIETVSLNVETKGNSKSNHWFINLE